MAVTKVTKARMVRKDNDRLQVHVDKETMAFLYKPLAAYLDDNAVAFIRDRYADAYMDYIRMAFQEKVRHDPAFRNYLLGSGAWTDGFLVDKIDHDLQTKALILWGEMGLKWEVPYDDNHR